ncbi:hypothetical protein ACFLTW_05585 [Chloroflexota bacterium]
MNENLQEVIKWVGLVFAAGFIGYLGRYLANIILDWARAKKTGIIKPGEATGSAAPITADASAPSVMAPTDKAAKKLAKAEVKLRKKGKAG